MLFILLFLKFMLYNFIMSSVFSLRPQYKLPATPPNKNRTVKYRSSEVHRYLLELENQKGLCDSDKIDRLFPPDFPMNRMERRDINRDFSILDNNKPFGRNEKLIFKILSDIKSNYLREYFLRLVDDYLKVNHQEFI